jgi:hypothetical protein
VDPAKPVAWTSEYGIHNLRRKRAEGHSHDTIQVRTDRRDDYNTVPLYTRPTADVDPATHTRASTTEGPDFCAECSRAAQEWVKWPCPTADVDPATDDLQDRAVRKCLTCGGEWWATDVTEHHRPWCSFYADWMPT